MQQTHLLFVFLFLLSACGRPSTPPGITVTCNELSFTLDPALGDAGECVSVPESSSSDQPSESISPSLESMDALVKSLRIKP